MKTRVRIDPNIRVRGNHTLAEQQDVDGPIAVGMPVEVYEPEADIVGEGRVVEIDSERDLIIVAVDWPSLRPRRTHKIKLQGSRPAADVLVVIESGWDGSRSVRRIAATTTTTSAPDLARVG